MVKLRKLGNIYYGRIRLPKGSSQTEKLINLKTKKEKEALKRITEVKMFEDEIKQGETISFSWQNEYGKAMVKEITLGESIDEYLKVRQNDLDNPLRPRTYDLVKLNMNRFKKYFGATFRISNFTQEDITNFKTHLASKLARPTVNINIRTVVTYWNWIKKGNYKLPELEIKQITVYNNKPNYISNRDFESILKHSDDSLQRIFSFYRDTGVRLREPFLGYIDGNFLIVPSDKSKTHVEREIPLDEDQIKVLEYMKQITHLEGDINSKTSTSHLPTYYSKKFQEACNKAKLKSKKKFHSLRHTYALRVYLASRDLYYVARLMGHSQITTTTVYTAFSFQRLEQDFPDLVSRSGNEFKFQSG